MKLQNQLLGIFAVSLCACTPAPKIDSSKTTSPAPVVFVAANAAAPLQPQDQNQTPARMEVAPRALPLPALELTGPILLKLMLAEIAVQRGQLNIAVSALLDVAQETKDPRVARRATEVAWAARYVPVALDAARLWMQFDPDSQRARQTLLTLLISQSRFTEAQNHVQLWLSQSPEQAGQRFLQLATLFSGSKDKIALLNFVRVIAQPYAQIPEAQFAIAQAAWDASDRDLAYVAAQQALVLRPGWDLAALFVAQILQRSSDVEALAYLSRFLQAHPGANELRLNYARLLVNARDYTEARLQFERLLKIAPENVEMAMAIATLSMQMKDYAIADAQLQRVLQLSPPDPDAVRVFLGQVNEELKRNLVALKWYDAVSSGSQFIVAKSRYVGILVKQGQLAQARQYLQGLQPEDAQLRLQLILLEASILRDAGAYAEAFNLLGQATVANTESTDLLYEYAMAAEKVDRVDVLEVNLRKVIELQPSHAHAYNALGFTLADRNLRLVEARELIEKGLQLSPDDPFILDSLGWVLHRQGLQQEALIHLRRAYGLRVDAEIAAHLGEVLWVLGRREEARKIWSEAQTKAPGNELLNSTIKRLEAISLQSAP